MSITPAEAGGPSGELVELPESRLKFLADWNQPDQRVRVECREVFQQEAGLPVLVLSSPQELQAHVCVSDDEAVAVWGVMQHAYDPREQVQDLLANLVNQLGGRLTDVWLQPLGPGRFTAAVRLVTGRQEIVAPCRAGEAIYLALRFGAPIYVPASLFERHADSLTAPNNWFVADFVNGGGVEIRRLRMTPQVVLSHMPELWASIALGGGLSLAGWATGWSILYVLSAALVVSVGWHAVRLMSVRDRWRIAENSLEVWRRDFGWTRARRYVGATLVLGCEPGDARTDRDIALYVVERGRTYKLASSVLWDDVEQLGRFLAAYTGWPLKDRRG